MTDTERIAQLEATVATLQEQVSALSVQTQSGESGYYTSKYSGEEIDSLLDIVAAMQS